jgi:hypothetical protein
MIDPLQRCVLVCWNAMRRDALSKQQQAVAAVQSFHQMLASDASVVLAHHVLAMRFDCCWQGCFMLKIRCGSRDPCLSGARWHQ